MPRQLDDLVRFYDLLSQLKDRIGGARLAAFAQFDNDVRSDRTRAGMKAALEIGRCVFLAPIGYTNAPRSMGRSLLQDPERAPISATLREILVRRQKAHSKDQEWTPENYVFGDEIGGRLKDIRTAWDNAVLKAHGIKAARSHGGRVSAENRARLRKIDLNFHDLRHEAGSWEPDGRSTRSRAGWVTASSRRPTPI